jgi:hypothetical protein
MARPRVVAVVTADLVSLRTIRHAAGTPSGKVPLRRVKSPLRAQVGQNPPSFVPQGFKKTQENKGNPKTRGDKTSGVKSPKIVVALLRTKL